MVAADGKEDEVFVTLSAPDQLLWLNYTDAPVERNGTSLPPIGIAVTSIP